MPPSGSFSPSCAPTSTDEAASTEQPGKIKFNSSVAGATGRSYFSMHMHPNYLLDTHFPSRAQAQEHRPMSFPPYHADTFVSGTFLFSFFEVLQVTHQPKGVDA